MVESPFFEEIRRRARARRKRKLSGFGNFQLRDKPQRPGRNPKTGEEIPISARRVWTFHASQKLRPWSRRRAMEQRRRKAELPAIPASATSTIGEVSELAG